MARKDGAGGARLRLTTALVTLVTALVLPLVVNVSTAKAAGVALTKGDVLGAVGNGSVKHFDPSGTLLDTLVGAPSTFTTGMAFDSDGNLYATGFDGEAVSKFDTLGNFLGTFGTGYDAHPESITLDAAGNVYVGQADGTGAVLKFDASGNPLAQYGVASEDRGSDWIDLAADQCTLFYTSEGTLVKRFNVCTNAQLPDFATLPSGAAFALRIQPSDEVLVAATSAVYRLDATGALVQTYAIPNSSTLFALNLDPDGTSFWTGDLSSGDIFKVDIATGNILKTFNAASFTALPVCRGWRIEWFGKNLRNEGWHRHNRHLD
jgi:sugar lactone lactonase YvrE